MTVQDDQVIPFAFSAAGSGGTVSTIYPDPDDGLKALIEEPGTYSVDVQVYWRNSNTDGSRWINLMHKDSSGVVLDDVQVQSFAHNLPLVDNVNTGLRVSSPMYQYQAWSSTMQFIGTNNRFEFSYAQDSGETVIADYISIRFTKVS